MLFWLCVIALLVSGEALIVRTSRVGEACGERLLSNNEVGYLVCEPGVVCNRNSICAVSLRKPMDRCESSNQCELDLPCRKHADGIMRCGGGYDLSINFFKPYGVYRRKSQLFDGVSYNFDSYDCTKLCNKRFLIYMGTRCYCIDELLTEKMYDKERVASGSSCTKLGNQKYLLDGTDAMNPVVSAGCDPNPNYKYYWSASTDSHVFVYYNVKLLSNSDGLGNAFFGLSQEYPFRFVGWYKKPSYYGRTQSCIKRNCIGLDGNPYSCDNCRCDRQCAYNRFMGIADVTDGSHSYGLSMTCLCDDNYLELVDKNDPNIVMNHGPNCNNDFLLSMQNYSMNPPLQSTVCNGRYAWGTIDDDLIALYEKSNVKPHVITESDRRSSSVVTAYSISGTVGFFVLVYLWSVFGVQPAKLTPSGALPSADKP